jgi:hypothetical protein
MISFSDRCVVLEALTSPKVVRSPISQGKETLHVSMLVLLEAGRRAQSYVDGKCFLENSDATKHGNVVYAFLRSHIGMGSREYRKSEAAEVYISHVRELIQAACIRVLWAFTNTSTFGSAPHKTVVACVWRTRQAV